MLRQVRPFEVPSSGLDFKRYSLRDNINFVNWVACFLFWSSLVVCVFLLLQLAQTIVTERAFLI